MNVGFASIQDCGSFLPYMVTDKNIVRHPVFVKEKGRAMWYDVGVKPMNMRKIVPLLFLLLSVLHPSFGEVFRFLYTLGETYRILSIVKEDVYINGRFSHQAEILNRIAVEVVEVKEGKGKLRCTFHTSEESRSSQRIFTWGRNYESEFWRDSQGRMTIPEQYYMPIVRHVPFFPAKDLQVGDEWSSEGEEVHDLRDSFGLREPLRFPIYPRYLYKGDRQWEGKNLKVIEISYTLFHRFTPPVATRLYPVRLGGMSRQTLLWDPEDGRPYAYEEEFDFLFELSGGDRVEYRGKAEAKVVESVKMDKESLVQEITKDLRDMAVPNTQVRRDPLGVTLTLENIQFLPDSAVLVSEEKEKLKRIAEILKKYPERDILITGHTALAGTAEGRKRLSEERAQAVGEFLLSLGVRNREQIITRGMGAEVPLADNATEEGRRKNRRVEITILEN
jgi:outer membrane protein OmpA-like peptidoglycan-associated protein